jgi:hypothetical protein
MQNKIKRKTEKIFTKKVIQDWMLIACSSATVSEKGAC